MHRLGMVLMREVGLIVWDSIANSSHCIVYKGQLDCFYNQLSQLGVLTVAEQ